MSEAEVLNQINNGFCENNFEIIRSSLFQYLVNKTDIIFQDHPLGFKHFKLGNISTSEEFRLHVWPEILENQDNQLMIHDHSFDFISCVIFGKLLNTTYQIKEEVNADGYLYKVIFRNGMSSLILDKSFQSIERNELKVIQQGEFYTIKKTDFHETTNLTEFSISLIKIIRSENKTSNVYSTKLNPTITTHSRLPVSSERNKELKNLVIQSLLIL